MMTTEGEKKEYPCGCKTQQVGKILFYDPCNLDHCEVTEQVLEQGKNGLEIRWRRLR
jgi:hypothetical protein